MSLHRVLGALAVVQLGLAAITWWPADPNRGERPLVDWDRAEITAIEIQSMPVGDAEPRPVRLSRTDDGWVIDSAAGYPATREKVEALLDKLLALRVREPIVTSRTSHAALKVAEDDYGRQVSVEAGEGEKRVFFIGAATSNSLNVRLDGESDVYRARGASEWVFSSEAAAFYDRSYVKADPESLTAVSIRNPNGELRFEKTADGWALVGLDPEAVSDAEAIDAFLRVVTAVSMTEPAGEGTRPEYGFDDGPRVDWTLAAEDQSLTGGYRVGAAVGSDSYVKAAGHAFTVKARTSAFARLREAVADDFVRTPDPVPGLGPAGG